MNIPPDYVIVIDQGTYERLDTLVGHDGNLDEARVFEARGKEVNAVHRAVEKPHHDLAEVVLGKLPGQVLPTFMIRRKMDIEPTQGKPLPHPRARPIGAGMRLALWAPSGKGERTGGGEPSGPSSRASPSTALGSVATGALFSVEGEAQF